jgi:LmbE family N-acetylglucosaminyl deacetylase/ActR/RegA family two-component response regulator
MFLTDASGSPVRVLVIDGDKNSCKTACTLLKSNGYLVDIAETGAKAIEQTEHTRYNLLLIAAALPDMAGVKLLTRIHETIPKTRKIMLANIQRLSDALAAVDQGADTYITKPFDKEKLLGTVEAQLAKQKIKIPRQGSHANVLFIGAHPDDVELGCGGTLIKHVKNGDNVFVLIFTNGEKGVTDVDSASGIDRQRETVQALKIAGVGLSNIYFLQLPDTELWQHRQKVMNTISKFCETFHIHLVYTHSNKAQHQDHVTIFDETMRGAKKAWGIMTYESHGATNPSFSPNMFVDITDVIDKKIAMINCHQSQIQKASLKVESVVALAQFRSSQSEEFHYAEAFEIIKMTITSHPKKEFSVRDLLKIASSAHEESQIQGLPFQL